MILAIGSVLLGYRIARSITVPLTGLVDLGAERARLERELDKVRKEIDKLDRKLSNASFVAQAPAEVVEENRRRRAGYQDQASKLQSGLERLA